METVRISRDELLKVIKENRKLHQEMTEEAQKGYRQNVIAWLEKALREMTETAVGGETPTQIPFQKPENHIEDYNRVIRMLQMSLRTEIDLNEEEFSCYVMDDWTWKSSFVRSSRVYGYTGPTGPTGI